MITTATSIVNLLIARTVTCASIITMTITLLSLLLLQAGKKGSHCNGLLWVLGVWVLGFDVWMPRVSETL